MYRSAISGPFRYLSKYLLKDKNWSYENPLLDKVERKSSFGRQAADKHILLYWEPEEPENGKINKSYAASISYKRKSRKFKRPRAHTGPHVSTLPAAVGPGQG